MIIYKKPLKIKRDKRLYSKYMDVLLRFRIGVGFSYVKKFSFQNTTDFTYYLSFQRKTFTL